MFDIGNFTECESKVYDILKDHPETRSNDYLLYYLYCIQSADIDPSLSFAEAMQKHYELNLPSWETVTRCRRKIQERNTWLKPEASRVRRQKRRKDFETYARI